MFLFIFFVKIDTRGGPCAFACKGASKGFCIMWFGTAH